MGAATEAERLEHALGIAFRFLNRRDRTVAEIRARLDREEVDEPTREAVVAQLIDEGYLDDARYAQRFAEDRRTLDGWGSARISERLLKFGVPRDLVEAALARHDHHEELDAAFELLRRRYGAPPEDAHERNRMLGLLLRKGYDSELAYEALRVFERSLTVD